MPLAAAAADQAVALPCSCQRRRQWLRSLPLLLPLAPPLPRILLTAWHLLPASFAAATAALFATRAGWL